MSENKSLVPSAEHDPTDVPMEAPPVRVASSSILTTFHATKSNASLSNSNPYSGSVDDKSSIKSSENSSVKDAHAENARGSPMKAHGILHSITQGLVDTMSKISSGRNSRHSSFRSQGSDSPILSELEVREEAAMAAAYLGANVEDACNNDRRSVISNASDVTTNGSVPRTPGGRRTRIGLSDWSDQEETHVAVNTSIRNTTCSNIGSTVLYNFVSQYGQKIISDVAIFQQFEELIAATLLKFPDEKSLREELTNHGWSFEENQFMAYVNEDEVEGMVDIEQLRQALGTVYLSSQTASEQNIERYWDANTMKFAKYTLSNDDLMKAFLPDILFKHLEEAPGTTAVNRFKGVGVYSTNVTGACLLVDISGFTKLSSSFCMNGINGLDELHKITNGFLAHLVSLVYSHGGDVVYFAGDALICIFPALESDSSNKLSPSAKSNMSQQTSYSGRPHSGRSRLSSNSRSRRSNYNTTDEESTTRRDDDGFSCAGSMSLSSFNRGGRHNKRITVFDDSSYQLSVVRAVKCGVALKDYEANDLVTHIGVSCGEMHLTTLGGYRGNWTYLLNGHCISQLSSCLDEAPRKQLVMTNECASLLQNCLTKHVNTFTSCQLASSNHMLLSLDVSATFPQPGSRFKSLPSEDMSHIVQSFLSRTVVDAIGAGTFHSMSELREVTTLFLNLDSYSPTLYSDPISLQSFFLIVQESISETGGFLRQFLIDDKGCVLIIMWGVPSFSYANNPARAIDCAVSIFKNALSIGHKCSVGITTGSVFCGNIGSVIRRDYVGIGADVNLAARLMSKAKGRVLIDHLTYKKLPLSGHGYLKPAESMKMKGLDHPVVPFYISDCREIPHMCNSDDLNNKANRSLLRKDVQEILKSQVEKIVKVVIDNTVVVKPTSNPPLRSRSKVGIDISMHSGKPSRQMSIRALLSEDPTIAVGTRLELMSYDSGDEHREPTVKHSNMGRPPLVESSMKYLAVNSEGSIKIRNCNTSEVSPICGNSPRDVPTHNGNYQFSFNPNLFNSVNASVNMNVASGDVEDLETRFAPKKALANSGNLLGFTVIKGPPGSGKTTAAQFFIQYAKKRGLNTIYVKASASDHNVSYGIVKNLFIRVVGKQYFSGSYLQRSTLVEMLRIAYPSDDISDINIKVNHLARIFGFTWGDSSIHGPIVRNADECVFHKLFLMALKASNAAIVVEGAHFCDELSWMQFSFLCPIHCNVSILLTIRDSNVASAERLKRRSSLAVPMDGMSSASRKPFGSPEGSVHRKSSMNPLTSPPEGSASRRSNFGSSGNVLANFGSKYKEKETNNAARANPKGGGTKISFESYNTVITGPNTKIVEIAALCREDVKLLLTQSLALNVISDVLVDYVHELSEGNPFWCKAISGYILESGYDVFLENINDQVDTDRALDALVLARFEKLDHMQQTVVKHAAVLGDEFLPQELSACLPNTLVNCNLGAILTSLIDAGFLYYQEDVSQSYIFQNDLIRDVLYELLPPSETSRIHDTVARYIEMANANNLEPCYQILAYHFSLSKKGRADAFKYTLKSAHLAISTGALGDGLVYASTAFPMLATLVEAKELEECITMAIKCLQPKSLVSKVSDMYKKHVGSIDKNSDEQKYIRLRRLVVLKMEAITEKKADSMTDAAEISASATIERNIVNRDRSASESLCEVPVEGRSSYRRRGASAAMPLPVDVSFHAETQLSKFADAPLCTVSEENSKGSPFKDQNVNKNIVETESPKHDVKQKPKPGSRSSFCIIS